MKPSTVIPIDHWDELFDRDIETLIAGGTPANSDLAALQSLIAQLRALVDAALPDDFVEFHATESAAVAAARRARIDDRAPRGAGALILNLRRRLTAAATSLVMLVGATGVAWAADGAVPGDWNYGIDRALEAIGLGNGGESERLRELEAIAANPEEEPADAVDQFPPNDALMSPEKATGLARAEQALANSPGIGGQSAESRARATTLLQTLNDVGPIHGKAIADSVRSGDGKAAEPRTPGQTGRPDDQGAPGKSGPSAKPAGAGPSRAADKP